MDTLINNPETTYQAFKNFISAHGILGLLLLIIVLLVIFSERVGKARKLIFIPLFRLFGIGAKGYIALKVTGTLTEFLQRYFKGLLPSNTNFRIKLKWVTSSQDPILTQNGVIILRMQETGNQTLNTLSAARHALPLSVCSTIRHHIERQLESAMDLTILRKLTEALGKNARPVFQKYFLTPEFHADEKIADLFRKLVEIDDAGIFVPIFLQELELLGDVLYNSASNEDKTQEIILFLQYLLPLAQREEGEHVQLVYRAGDINIGIILIARDIKARTQGINPYIQRINLDLREGCETIYLVAYSKQFDFLKQISNALKGDNRLNYLKSFKQKFISKIKGGEKDELAIDIYRRNAIFDGQFEERLLSCNLRLGDQIEGTVIDVAEQQASIEIAEFFGIITRRECDWGNVYSCHDLLKVGSKYSFLIKNIDAEKQRIELSRRLPETDPWRSKNIPNIDEIVKVTISQVGDIGFIGISDDGIQLLIPLDEIAWIQPGQRKLLEYQNTIHDCKVIGREDESRIIRGSIKQLLENPWPAIEKRFHKGAKLRGTVIEITKENVRVNLDGGLTGLISGALMKRAGFEYADFENTLAVGQKLDVVVIDLQPRRGRLRLDLQRNQ